MMPRTEPEFSPAQNCAIERVSGNRHRGVRRKPQHRHQHHQRNRRQRDDQARERDMVGDPPAQQRGHDAGAVDRQPADRLVQTDGRRAGFTGGPRLLVAGDHRRAVDGDVGARHHDREHEHRREEDHRTAVEERRQQIAEGREAEQADQQRPRAAVGVDQEADDRLEAPGEVRLREQVLGGAFGETVPALQVAQEREGRDALKRVRQPLHHVREREDDLEGVDALPPRLARHLGQDIAAGGASPPADGRTEKKATTGLERGQSRTWIS